MDCIPEEIWLLIAEWLNYGDNLALSTVNSSFNKLIDVSRAYSICLNLRMRHRWIVWYLSEQPFSNFLDFLHILEVLLSVDKGWFELSDYHFINGMIQFDVCLKCRSQTIDFSESQMKENKCALKWFRRSMTLMDIEEETFENDDELSRYCDICLDFIGKNRFWHSVVIPKTITY